jgi:hypothetical protein
MTTLRLETTKALAKCLAYLAIGDIERAQQWAHTLIELLRDAGLQLTH